MNDLLWKALQLTPTAAIVDEAAYLVRTISRQTWFTR